MLIIVLMFRIVLLACHLFAMNFAGAAPLIAAWIDFKRPRGVAPTRQSADVLLLKWSIGGLWLGALFGGLLMLVAWLTPGGVYFDTLTRVPTFRWKMIAGEFGVFFACQLACLALWTRQRRFRWVAWLLAIAATTNLLYHFPLFFASLAVMQQQPELAQLAYDDVLRRQLRDDPQVIAQVIHVVLASLAVGGVMAASLAGRGKESERDATVIRGARIALLATMGQLASGPLLLMQLNWNAQERLFGGDWLAMGLLVGGILLALRLLHLLGALSLGESDRGMVRAAVHTMMLTILVMTATLKHLEVATGLPDGVEDKPAAAVPSR